MSSGEKAAICGSTISAESISMLSRTLGLLSRARFCRKKTKLPTDQEMSDVSAGKLQLGEEEKYQQNYFLVFRFHAAENTMLVTRITWGKKNH